MAVIDGNKITDMSESFQNLVVDSFGISRELVPMLLVSDLNTDGDTTEGSEIVRNQAYIIKRKPIKQFLFREHEEALYIEETRWM
jgi:hypothetical protein